jgi:Asp23 family, cell envelope-related function
VNDPQTDGRPLRQLLNAAELPCGADVDLLLEQVAGGRGADRDAHQQQCVHCQAALGELVAVWAPVAELAAAPVAAPPGLVAAVMSQIRTLLRDIWYTVQTTEFGAVRIALGRSTQGRAATLAGRTTLAHRDPRSAVGVLGGTAVVDLAIAVSYGDPVHQIARDVQRHVIAALGDQAGLRSVVVNVTVDDILGEDDR